MLKLLRLTFLISVQLYLRLRFKLLKIDGVLEFKQLQWLKHRREAKKDCDKDGKAWYKLINNAVYGKTMENLRNWIPVRFANNKKDCLKWASRPSYCHKKYLTMIYSQYIKAKLH